mgnify:CR=1 FL=1
MIKGNSIFKYIIGFGIALFYLSAITYGQQNNYIGKKQLYYGAAYYPEAWDFKTVDEDIERMKELNMNVMRMAEFSWALMEPSEGNYQFEWLHDVIGKLHANGIDIILGTPTATPPAWMAEKYPEIFVMDETGQRRQHGARRNCSYTSQVYRDFCRKICVEMAKEFGEKKGVIGWQTDNEFHLTADYSRESEILWHEWLEEKYQSIDMLNSIWVTNLWSQKYDSFHQIPMPRTDIWHHPSLRLDWKRFITDQVVIFQDIQLEAIRQFSDKPITHDGMPGQSMNYPKIFENLDFMAVNAYHSFPVYNRVQINYDRMRGYNMGMHWLFETAPNNSGGGSEGKTWFIHQPNGAMRAALWMNYALGAQGSMFWLWRQHPAGHEMPHGSMISSWNKPTANYDDLKALGAELKEFSPLLMNAPVKPAEIALVYSHENDEGLRIEQYSNNIRYYTDWTERFYRPVSDAFLHRVVIHEYADINDYKIIFAPLMPMISPEFNKKLKEWVEAGGILIAGPMTGYRSEYWTSFTNHALGNFSEWSGIYVDSRIPIDAYNVDYDDVLKVYLTGATDIPMQVCGLWSEALMSPSGKILARYKHGMHDEHAAIIENKVGKGKVVFLGTDPGEEIIEKLIVTYAAEQGIKPLAAGEKNVVVVPRADKDANYMLVVNIENNTKNIIFDHSMVDLVTSENIGAGSYKLEPYQVMIGKVKK